MIDWIFNSHSFRSSIKLNQSFHRHCKRFICNEFRCLKSRSNDDHHASLTEHLNPTNAQRIHFKPWRYASCPIRRTLRTIHPFHRCFHRFNFQILQFCFHSFAAHPKHASIRFLYIEKSFFSRKRWYSITLLLLLLLLRLFGHL